MMSDGSLKTNAITRLRHPVDRARDHIRGGGAPDKVSVLSYADLLCPYCQRLRRVLVRLREALGDRLEYVFRHFPNERAHTRAPNRSRARPRRRRTRALLGDARLDLR